MAQIRRFDLVMDRRKKVTCPSGNRYYMMGGHPIPVAEEDAEFFLSQPEVFTETGAESSPAPDKRKGDTPPPSASPLTSEKVEAGKRKSKPKPKKKPEPVGYDLKKLKADKVIEDDVLAKKTKPPWTCPVCGKKRIMTKSGLRSHVGSAKCIELAEAKQAKD